MEKKGINGRDSEEKKLAYQIRCRSLGIEDLNLINWLLD